MNLVHITTSFVLGHVVQDTATGFTGTVTSMTFDYPGTARACVEPLSTHMTLGDNDEPRWFDVSRLVPIN